MLHCIKVLVDRRRRFNRMLTELQGYSERDLYELGIPLVDIRHVAWMASRTA